MADQSKKLQIIVELIKSGDASGAVKELEAIAASSDKAGKSVNNLSEAAGKGKKPVKDLEDAASHGAESLDKLKEAAAKVSAAITSVVAVHSAIEAYTNYERAVSKLNGVLQATKQYSAEYSKELIDDAKMLAKETSFKGNDLMGAQAFLLSFGQIRADMPKTMEAVVDLATLMGTSAESAAWDLARALEGQDMALKRMGFTIDSSLGKYDNFQSLLKQVEERAGGLSKAFEKTDAGQLEKAGRAVGALNKTFGELIVQGIKPGTVQTAKLTLAFNDLLKTNDGLRDMVSTVARLSLILGAATAAFKGFSFMMGTKSMADVKDFTSAIEKIPTEIKVMVAVVVAEEVIRASIAAYDYVVARGQEKKSEELSTSQNDNRKKDIRNKILQGQADGSIDSDKAGDYLYQLDEAFAKKTETRTRTVSNDFGAHMAAGKYEVDLPRNLTSEKSILDFLSGELNPSQKRGAKDPKEAESKMQMEDKAKALAKIGELRDKLSLETLDGIEKERAANQKEYESAIKKIDDEAKRGKLKDADLQVAMEAKFDAYAVMAKKEGDIDKKQADEEAKLDEERKRRQSEIEALKDSMEINGLQGVAKEIAIEDKRFEMVRAHIEAEKGINDELKEQLLGLNKIAHERVLAEIDLNEVKKKFPQHLVEEGKVETEKLQTLSLGGEWAKQTAMANAEWDKRKIAVTAYYDYEIEMARRNKDETTTLESQKTKTLAQLETQRSHATSQVYTEMTRIGISAENQFASGMAGAFSEIIRGSKSADQAFKEFGANFLSQVGQMIMQTLILLAVQRAVAGIFGGGAAPVVKGAAAAGSMEAGSAAAGFYAQGGIKMMAGGGMGMTDGATYLPQFNAIGGEAGREMLAVLSRPMTIDYAGIAATVGDVGPNRMALLRADQLEGLMGRRQMAAGGTVGGGSASNGGSAGGDASSQMDININLSPGLEARIVNTSVKNARVAIVNDMSGQSNLSQATKRLVG